MCDYEADLAENAETVPVADAPHSLPLPWLASFVYRTCSPLPFPLAAENVEDVEAALAERIAEEVKTVQALSLIHISEPTRLGML